HGRLEVPIGHRVHVPFGVIIVVQQGAFAAVEVIGLRGGGCAPAHDHAAGEHPGGQVVPAGAFNDHLNADLPDLLRGGHAHRLPDRVSGGVQHGEGGFQTVLFHNAVPVGVRPAG